MARFQTRLGECLTAAGGTEEAHQILSQAIQTLDNSVGDEHPHTRDARDALAASKKQRRYLMYARHTRASG